MNEESICLQKKGRFSHPGQKGRSLSPTRGLPEHVPGEQDIHLRCDYNNILLYIYNNIQKPTLTHNLEPMQSGLAAIVLPRFICRGFRLWKPCESITLVVFRLKRWSVFLYKLIKWTRTEEQHAHYPAATMATTHCTLFPPCIFSI